MKSSTLILVIAYLSIGLAVESSSEQTYLTDLKVQLKVVDHYFKCKNTRWLTWVTCDRDNVDELAILNHFINQESPVRILHDVPELLNIIQFGESTQNGIITSIHCFSRIITELHEDVQRSLFHLRMHWLIFPEASMTISDVSAILQPGLLLVNNDVGVISVSQNGSTDISIYEVYKFKQLLPLKTRRIYFGAIDEMPDQLCKVPPIAIRRKNFELVPLRSALVIANPHLFTSITDVRTRDIDIYGKVNWLTLNNLRSTLNFSFDFFQIDEYGSDKYGNGSFSGLVGYLQRREVDFGMSLSQMRPDRIHILDRTAELFLVQAPIIFRQPPLASIANIFVLPFEPQVWVCLGVFVCLAILVTYAQKLIDTNCNLLESTSVTIGAVCQQGRNYLPTTVSGRLSVLFIFTISMFIYTSYSASIVALLQSPSTSIKTISDLTNSPFKVACQNIIYNKWDYEKPGNPAEIEALYVKKIKRKWDSKNYIPVDVGMRRVQTEQFAFQVESHAAAKYISEHFHEYEKCQLGEIEVFKLPITTTSVQKNSSLREVFTINLRRQKEVGLVDKLANEWLGKTKKCKEQAHFTTVGLVESKAAFFIMLIGIGLSVMIYLFELLFNRLKMVYNHSMK